MLIYVIMIYNWYLMIYHLGFIHQWNFGLVCLGKSRGAHWVVDELPLKLWCVGIQYTQKYCMYIYICICAHMHISYIHIHISYTHIDIDIINIILYIYISCTTRWIEMGIYQSLPGFFSTFFKVFISSTNTGKLVSTHPKNVALGSSIIQTCFTSW